jgi:hypothetical protein
MNTAIQGSEECHKSATESILEFQVDDFYAKDMTDKQTSDGPYMFAFLGSEFS